MFLTRLELRVTSFECPHFSKTLCQTFQDILETPRIRDIPMFILSKAFQLRQVIGHFRIRQWLTITTVISHRQCYEVISHNATDIQVVVETLQGFIVKELMCCVSHGLSSIKLLSPTKWEADTSLCSDASYVCQLDTLIILHFGPKVKCFFDALVLSKRAVSTSQT